MTFSGYVSPNETSQMTLKAKVKGAHEAVEEARKKLADIDKLKADLEQGIKSVEEKFIPACEKRLEELESYPYDYYLEVSDSGDYGTGTLYVTVIKVPQGADVINAHDVRFKDDKGIYSISVMHYDRLEYYDIPHLTFGKKPLYYNGPKGRESTMIDDEEETDAYIKRCIPIILETAKKYNVPDDHIIDLSNREIMFETMQEREAKASA